MKTLKITEETHYQLTVIKLEIYNKSKIKLTFNEIISMLCIQEMRKDGTK